MRDDVHIIGLGLEYQEVDVWWMIYYKATLKKRNYNVGETYYYHFTAGGTHMTDVETARQGILTSYGVTVKSVPVEANDYNTAWDTLLKDLQDRIRTTGDKL